MIRIAEYRNVVNSRWLSFVATLVVLHDVARVRDPFAEVLIRRIQYERSILRKK